MTLAFSIIAGLVLLFIGGDLLVRGAVAIAERMGIPVLVIGLTVVAFGTSAPELMVSVEAVLAGTDDVAIGNVVGSNIANILLIAAVTALVRPIAARTTPIYREATILVGASLLLILFSMNGFIEAAQGIILLVLLIAYLGHSYWLLRRGKAAFACDPENGIPSTRPMWRLIISVVGGLVGLLVGAEFLVDGAVDLARIVGVSEAAIGLTLVAVGTSLPELATCVAAAYRRHPEVAIGTVVGSNIFNILAITGVASLVGQLEVSPEFRTFDLWVLLGTAILFVPFLVFRLRLGRAIGVVFLCLYTAYTAVQFVNP